jgi:hypothetical protein
MPPPILNCHNRCNELYAAAVVLPVPNEKKRLVATESSVDKTTHDATGSLPSSFLLLH